MSNPFGVILITSLDRNLPLRESSKVLITAIAKGKNTGMEYNEDQTRLLATGTPPVLLQGVVADITLNTERTPVIHVLDQIGRKTSETIKLRENGFRIDGAKYQAIYYLLEYD
jgi:hypothetical protein